MAQPLTTKNPSVLRLQTSTTLDSVRARKKREQKKIYNFLFIICAAAFICPLSQREVDEGE